MPDTLAGLAGLSPVSLGLFWPLLPLLLATILWDLRRMRIPNALVATYLGLFAVAVLPFSTLPDLALRCGAAALVLGLFMAAFAAGLIGGGDVKLLATLVLFVPPGRYTLFAFTVALCLLVCIAAVLWMRRSLPAQGHGWQFLQDHRRLPMGPAFGAAGLVFWGVPLA